MALLTDSKAIFILHENPTIYVPPLNTQPSQSVQSVSLKLLNESPLNSVLEGGAYITILWKI
jgi:hypothetical protein